MNDIDVIAGVIRDLDNVSKQDVNMNESTRKAIEKSIHSLGGVLDSLSWNCDATDEDCW